MVFTRDWCSSVLSDSSWSRDWCSSVLVTLHGVHPHSVLSLSLGIGVPLCSVTLGVHLSWTRHGAHALHGQSLLGIGIHPYSVNGVLCS